MLMVASRRLLAVFRLTFVLCFGFDLLHSRKCSPLSHIYVLVNAECILLQNFQFGKLIYADYFL